MAENQFVYPGTVDEDTFSLVARTFTAETSNPGLLCALRALECLLRVAEVEPALVLTDSRLVVSRVLDADDPVRLHAGSAMHQSHSGLWS